MEIIMAFEIGQRVKVVGDEYKLSTCGTGGTLGQTGIVIENDDPDKDDLSCRVKLDNQLMFWFAESNLELIPDDGKRPAQYPPLRAMVDDKPLDNWMQVLGKPLAASQPHLYLLGHYRSDIYDIEQFAKDTPRFILMSTIACSNAAIGGSETQPYHIVFVIDEE
jgi:hypothetical protein